MIRDGARFSSPRLPDLVRLARRQAARGSHATPALGRGGGTRAPLAEHDADAAGGRRRAAYARRAGRASCVPPMGERRFEDRSRAAARPRLHPPRDRARRCRAAAQVRERCRIAVTRAHRCARPRLERPREGRAPPPRHPLRGQHSVAEVDQRHDELDSPARRPRGPGARGPKERGARRGVRSACPVDGREGLGGRGPGGSAPAARPARGWEWPARSGPAASSSRPASRRTAARFARSDPDVNRARCRGAPQRSTATAGGGARPSPARRPPGSHPARLFKKTADAWMVRVLGLRDAEGAQQPSATNFVADRAATPLPTGLSRPANPKESPHPNSGSASALASRKKAHGIGRATTHMNFKPTKSERIRHGTDAGRVSDARQPASFTHPGV